MIVTRTQLSKLQGESLYQNLDAVTFDFHDTLAICDDWFQVEIRQLVPYFLRWYAKDAGIAVSECIFDRSVSTYRALRLGVMDHGIEMDAEACVSVVTRDLGMEIPASAIARGVCAVMNATLNDSVPVPGVVEAVRSLRGNGVRLGIVSSAVYHPFITWSLEKFGIGDQFDSIVTSARCGFYKSRTEIYQSALDDLGARASRTIHIGDSHKYDVETPSRLGMKTIWYEATGAASGDHLADVVVSSLTNVEQIVGKLAGGMER